MKAFGKKIKSYAGFSKENSGLKMKFPNITKVKGIKKMEQFTGAKSTAKSAIEGRLKIANTKRKIAKVAIKKAKKTPTGMKATRTIPAY